MIEVTKLNRSNYSKNKKGFFNNFTIMSQEIKTHRLIPVLVLNTPTLNLLFVSPTSDLYYFQNLQYLF